MSVKAILTRLGLSEYVALFETHHVDEGLVADLTDADLKEIGVTSLGHRRKILSAFSNVETQAAMIERRNVVIIFVDLVAFTTLIRSSEPEDAYALSQAFLNLVDKTVTEMGGTVERHVGDAVMAVFGAPTARGDEALRAVNFAYRIHMLVGELGQRRGVELKIRVGVAYGNVITRSAPGEDLSVVGTSVNLAARLSSEAEPGHTLISTDVREACGHVILVGPPNRHQLKGFDAPVESRELLGFSSGASSEFFGRREEIAAFDEVLRSAQASGTGQLIVLRGEAGIGKSALLSEWLARANADGFQTHSVQVHSFGVGQTRLVRADIVSALLERADVSDEDRPWLNVGQSVGLGSADTAIIAAASPELQARNRARAFAALLGAATANEALILAFEDAHWADGDMIELLAECCRQAHKLPLIVVATTRIEGCLLDDAWMERIAPTPCRSYQLGPLQVAECQKMASAVVGADRDMSDAIERSSGHPLYLEQLLRHKQEDKGSRLPNSIHTIIQARIDLLDMTDRHAARAAAVLGHSVDLDALRHVLGDPGYNPHALLERRILRDEPRGLAFHHALIRDCLYESILREDRAAFHRAAADWYESSNLALRADHLAKISAAEAARAYLAAAEQLLSNWQNAEAVRLARAGLGETQSVDLICRLRLILAEALFQQNHTKEAIEEYSRAQSMDGISPVYRLKAMIGEITALRLVDRVSEAEERIETAMAIALAGQHRLELSHLQYLHGALLFPTGDFEASLAAHGEALALAEEVGNIERKADALSGRGDALYAQGRMAEAASVFDACLALCEDHGLLKIKAQNLFMRGTVRIYALDWDGALTDALESAELARNVGNARAEVVSRLTASWVFCWTGRLNEAINQAEIGLKVADDAGASRFVPFLSEALGHALYCQGDREMAVSVLTKAVQDMRAVKADRFIGPWVLGSAALAVGPGKEQDALLSEAETLLQAGAIGHNHFQFRRLAIDAAISAGNREAAAEQARMLSAFTAGDPTPWSNAEIARATAFASVTETLK